MDKKETIEYLYFDEKKKLTEIANELKVSVGYITKVLKQNPKYAQEKELRKTENLINRRNKQKELIYKNRKQNKKVDYEYLAVVNLHEQDVRELSHVSSIGIQALRKWNSNAYEYNPQKKRYEFNAGKSLKPEGLPKYIKI